MPKNRYYLLIAGRTTNILPEQPFFVLAISFFDQQICLPKRMIIAHCGTILDVVHAVDFDNQKIF